MRSPFDQNLYVFLCHEKLYLIILKCILDEIAFIMEDSMFKMTRYMPFIVL